jgi:hypothetical protein
MYYKYDMLFDPTIETIVTTLSALRKSSSKIHLKTCTCLYVEDSMYFASIPFVPP